MDAYYHIWLPHCRDCSRAKSRERYRVNGGKEAVYAQNLLNNYGMTVAEYETRVSQQGGRCAICGTTPDHRLHVDHNHRSGAVRDLLCRPCNYALGNAQDSLRVVRAMVAYLERHADADSMSTSEAGFA
ncbi:endonuclease VII domain-containing protein [Streptomyces microflavus]|uniref:endonuclease VII domain-containing protein n=1 Tax=Streptomyces microflavus TaxID=1919 RepID=UPI00340344B5